MFFISLFFQNCNKQTKNISNENTFSLKKKIFVGYFTYGGRELKQRNIEGGTYKTPNKNIFYWVLYTFFSRFFPYLVLLPNKEKS